ncbi:hypothetical protein N7G274_001937 [Stereocaulon virgatum]|uniref:Uncharacterized protein n=1 Tax=Stereocaulon virgatum TaxID=373712 RepID=A0ABR4AIB3_9LECA
MAPMALPLTPPTTPDFSAQLQRIETLHQQLKNETARAQEFLAKLKRGEEIQSQSQTQGKLSSPTEEDAQQPGPEKDVRNGKTSGKEGMCCCQHHQSKPLTDKEKKMAEEYRKSRLSSLGAANLPTLPTHVDEHEVQDLEKRVRGLEGRVRGFEGLPPDRELALQEVERLRRELEGLARRREGLFSLMDEKAKGHGNGKGSKLNGKAGGKVNAW